MEFKHLIYEKKDARVTLTLNRPERINALNEGLTREFESAMLAAEDDNAVRVVVLKGAGPVVTSNGQLPAVCAAGNPGMATAGMGDVLSGVIAALLGQGLALSVAAVAGVCLHARAGDRAAAAGERGLTARDVIAELRQVLNAAGAPA